MDRLFGAPSPLAAAPAPREERQGLLRQGSVPVDRALPVQIAENLHELVDNENHSYSQPNLDEVFNEDDFEAEQAPMDAIAEENEDDVVDIEDYPAAEAAAEALADAKAAEPIPAAQVAIIEEVRNTAVRIRLIAPRAVPIPAPRVILRKRIQGSIWSGPTVANKFIMKIRLEKSTPDSQAQRIHGAAQFNQKQTLDATCALCGFAFRHRMTFRKTTPGPAVSYDHFIPVNFAATVLRIVSPGGTYSQEEFAILGKIGDMVCWHCNYEKSQRMFITCPNTGSFESLMPNERNIGIFYQDLIESRHTCGFYRQTDTESTLIQQLPTPDLQREWRRERTRITIERARSVCDTIRRFVDYDTARLRLRAARSIIQAIDRALPTDANYIASQKKALYRKALIQAQYAKDELQFLRPWKEGTVNIEVLNSAALQPIPFSNVVIAYPILKGGPMPRPKSVKKPPFPGGKRNKTFRARRRRLPKLV